MITGNLNIDTQHNGNLEAALAKYHSGALSHRARPKPYFLAPDYSNCKMNTQTLKLTAALALIVTMLECLVRHYDGKTANQQRKANELGLIATRALGRIAKEIPDPDIYKIGKKIDVMNHRLGFDEQPSWIVYLAFCIAILADSTSKGTLGKTNLREFGPELDELLSGLQGLHDYLSKKEKALAQEHDAESTRLCLEWEGLF